MNNDPRFRELMQENGGWGNSNNNYGGSFNHFSNNNNGTENGFQKMINNPDIWG